MVTNIRPRTCRGERGVGGAGHGVFGDAGLGAEETGDEVDGGAGGRRDDASGFGQFFDDGQVGLEVFDVGLTGEDEHVIGLALVGLFRPFVEPVMEIIGDGNHGDGHTRRCHCRGSLTDKQR